MDGQNKDPADTLEYYQGQREPHGLQVVLNPAFTVMAFSLIIAPLTDNHFSVSSSSQTHDVFSSFLRKGSQPLTGEISILEGTIALEFYLTLHSLFLIKLLICWHDNGIRLQQCSFTCPTYPSSPLSLPKTSICFYILSILINSHIHLSIHE
jgi:hypothetical protein